MLEVIGLSEAAEVVYRTLVETRPSTPNELASVLCAEPRQVRRALDDLTSHGLVSPLPGGTETYTAVAPDAALEILFLAKEEQLRQARIQAARLAEEYHHAAGRQPAELVEVITGSTAILHRLEQIQRGARRTYLSLDRPPYLQTPAACAPANDRLHRHQVTVRAIYDRGALDAPGRLEKVEEAVRRGEVARVLPQVPVKMVLVDGRVALLPLQTASGTIESAVVVHTSTLLHALQSFFEVLWSQAMPLYAPLDATHVEGAAELTDEARRILALLTAGLPDDAIARQLELSPKTVQRRIRDLMARLGAATRFQAGLSAALRGWVQAPDGTPLVPAADGRSDGRVAERVAEDAGLAGGGVRHSRCPNPATRSGRCFELEPTE